MAFEFIDPRSTPRTELRSRGELPHLYKEGGSYFVTFRLLDAVETKMKKGSQDGCTTTKPRSNQDGCTTTAIKGHYCGAGFQPAFSGSQDGGATTPQKKQRLSPQREAMLIAQETEPPLRLGSCALARAEIAELVQRALKHFHDQRYYLSAWCVMPNHVHAVVTPIDGWELSAILHSWKSFTANEANKILKREGTFWERESFDHLIRTFDHFEAFVLYVENNPVEARLCRAPEDWPWSSAHLRKNAARTAAPQRKDV
jgi:REP element-mobilizing transposase RayT